MPNNTESKEELYNKLYLDCFKEHNSETLRIFDIHLIFYNHIIIYNEEPNIIAKYFLEKQYGSEYILESRTVNANLDGEYTDVEFFESRFKNGSVGHIEFDMNSYPRCKVFYVMDKVIQPMIETLDIGKIMDARLEKKKIVFLKNLDMVLKNTNDDKIIRKLINWLDRYVETTNFLMSCNIGFTELTKEICNYSIPIRTIRVMNTSKIDTIVEKWLLDNYNIVKVLNQERDIRSFLSFRYFMRSLVYEGYYDNLYELIDTLRTNKGTTKNKFMKIRDFIIQWLQENKNHNELLHEIIYYIGILDISDTVKIRYINELANRAKHTENSKKIIYHLENIISTFLS
jgi:hypothetical protein